MLLMEHCNDIDHCNPCGRSREGSWHGSYNESSTTHTSGGCPKQSPQGESLSDHRNLEILSSMKISV